MDDIVWTDIKGLNLIEGYIDGKLCFQIEANTILTDLREFFESEDIIYPSHYLIEDIDDGKLIAYELYNDINLEKHEINRQLNEDYLLNTIDTLQGTRSILININK